MATITITPQERIRLMGAGFPRQTIFKWLNRGVEPRQSTRYMVRQILGRDPWKAKNTKAPAA